MGEIYEVVVFTASLSKVDFLSYIPGIILISFSAQYADPVLDKLDIHQVVSHRLFRESCYNHKGNYVKVQSFYPSLLPFSYPVHRICHSWAVQSQIQLY